MQIADRLDSKRGGFLLSNEYVGERARILSKNAERMGYANLSVVNESPAHLAAFYPGFFSRILVDAPCSGEGMFRKSKEAVKTGRKSLWKNVLFAKRKFFGKPSPCFEKVEFLRIPPVPLKGLRMKISENG